MAFLFLVLLLWAGPALSSNSSQPPIYIDYHKRAVHGSNVLQYGSFIGFGTPSQNQSLHVSLAHNDIRITDVDYCRHSNRSKCQDSTGGFFESNSSSSWTGTTSDSSIPTSDSEVSGEDRVHLYTHYFESDPATATTLDRVPIQVVKNGSLAPSGLGLGEGATILESAYENHLISARAFSLYVGSGSDRAGGVVNGSLTLGGYDASRFSGPVYDYSIDSRSTNPFQVHVTDIVVNSTNKDRDVSLFDRGRFKNLPADFKGFDAVISTDEYPLSLPYEVTQNFMSTFSAETSDISDGSLRVSKDLGMTMSITLSNGFTVTLPREVMANVSGITPVRAQQKDLPTPFVLTTAWLSQVYLMANYDDKKFFLAQAVPKAPFISPTTIVSGRTPKPYKSPKKGSFDKVGLAGALVGGIIGSCALGIAGFVAVRLILQRRQRRREESELEEAKLGISESRENLTLQQWPGPPRQPVKTGQ